MYQEQTSGYLDMELLRFTTAGSVDDGKSTLIGRLLYDSKSIFEDQLDAIHKASVKKGNESVDLALLTDGLRAEREQGITIDVAYRYFATPKRKFIIADTPGHVQYTRNMVTGASTANAAIILIDARHGVVEQTYRHSYIAKLLEIPHVVVVVNKMDLIDWDQEKYNAIQSTYLAFAEKLGIKDVGFIPASALLGDNIVEKSENMKWYEGTTLLQYLEELKIEQDKNLSDARFPVQYVVRPQTTEFHDFRGFAGRIAGGVFKKGDEVVILPSRKTTKVKAIWEMGKELEEAFPPMAATLTLEDEIDISRGDMIVKTENQPSVEQEIDVMLCWMHENALQTRGKFILRHTTAETLAIVKEIQYAVDVNTQEEIPSENKLEMNGIGRATIKLAKPIYFDSYTANRQTGSVILINESTNETVGVGMII